MYRERFAKLWMHFVSERRAGGQRRRQPTSSVAGPMPSASVVVDSREESPTKPNVPTRIRAAAIHRHI